MIVVTTILALHFGSTDPVVVPDRLVWRTFDDITGMVVADRNRAYRIDPLQHNQMEYRKVVGHIWSPVVQDRTFTESNDPLEHAKILVREPGVHRFMHDGPRAMVVEKLPTRIVASGRFGAHLALLDQAGTLRLFDEGGRAARTVEFGPIDGTPHLHPDGHALVVDRRTSFWFATIDDPARRRRVEGSFRWFEGPDIGLGHVDGALLLDPKHPDRPPRPKTNDHPRITTIGTFQWDPASLPLARWTWGDDWHDAETPFSNAGWLRPRVHRFREVAIVMDQVRLWSIHEDVAREIGPAWGEPVDADQDHVVLVDRVTWKGVPRSTVRVLDHGGTVRLEREGAWRDATLLGSTLVLIPENLHTRITDHVQPSPIECIDLDTGETTTVDAARWIDP